MKRKVYAKTLNPECFEYQVYEYDIKEDDNIIIDGGREWTSFNNDVLKTIKDLQNDYDSWDYEYCLKHYYDNSITIYLRTMLNIDRKLNTREVHRIKVALNNQNEEELIITCLSIMRNKPFEKHTLRGYCQGEVVYLYAPKDYKDSFIDYIEAWYFGTGTEVEIDDTGKECNEAEDIEGFTFYTASWKTEDLKNEIIDNVLLKGESREDIEVVLWKYSDTRTIHIDQYKLAED